MLPWGVPSHPEYLAIRRPLPVPPQIRSCKQCGEEDSPPGALLRPVSSQEERLVSGTVGDTAQGPGLPAPGEGWGERALLAGPFGILQRTFWKTEGSGCCHRGMQGARNGRENQDPLWRGDQDATCLMHASRTTHHPSASSPAALPRRHRPRSLRRGKCQRGKR